MCLLYLASSIYHVWSHTKENFIGSVFAKHNWILDKSHTSVSYHLLLQDFKMFGKHWGNEMISSSYQKSRSLALMVMRNVNEEIFWNCMYATQNHDPGLWKSPIIRYFPRKDTFHDSFNCHCLCTSNVIFIVQCKHYTFYFSSIRLRKTLWNRLDVFS